MKNYTSESVKKIVSKLKDKPLMHYIKRGIIDNFWIHYIDNAIEYIPIFK